MVGRPGRTQSNFTAGELDPGLEDNHEIKYRAHAAKRIVNLEPLPQGGFVGVDGMALVADLEDDAAKLIPFTASDGTSYDLVLGDETIEIYGEDGTLLDTLASPYGADQLAEIDVAQQLDTAILFHKDWPPQRIRILAPTNWTIENAPIANLPTYDYGGTYTNGVSARWDLEFVGLTSGTSVFTLTVSGQETTSITYSNIDATLAPLIEAAILALPSISAGLTVTAPSAGKMRIDFTGAGNEGDGWAVSGRVVNATDAAVLSTKSRVGVEPGEPLISDERGWPRCGAFYQQRLIMGGFRSLPNAWIASQQGDYYNFDRRLDEANGSFLVPMDTAGGETILKITGQRNLLIFTNEAEYWLQDRALSKTTAPSHVKASEDGIAPGVPICQNEGAALFIYKNGSVVGEFAYTDTQGNFLANSISILSAHLIEDITGAALRRPSRFSDGALYACVRADGDMRLAKLLRSQDVTAFFRRETDGRVIDVSVNGRNEMMVIVERDCDTGPRRTLERLSPDTLFDCSEGRVLDPPDTVIDGLERHEGREIWAYGDGEIYGPFTVSGGAIELPVACELVGWGRWTPPLIELLPPARFVNGDTVVLRKGRIHSAQLKLGATTSIAIGANGSPPRDVSLRRYGEPEATELEAPFEGGITVRGLTNYATDPTLVITQKRPGLIAVRSITIEAKL